MTSIDILAAQVGYVCQSGSSFVLGSCFLVSSDIVVTCYHVLELNDKINKEYDIVWPRLSLRLTAAVIQDAISSDDDVAFLSLAVSIPPDTPILPLGIRYTYNGDFSSFGYRKIDNYNGLYTNGTIRSEIETADGRKLLQLYSDEIEQGMSGAPVFESSYGFIVGMISEFWSTNKSTDSSLAFAVPINRLIEVRPEIAQIIPEMNAVPKLIETGLYRNISHPVRLAYTLSEDELVCACTRAAFMVTADQLVDGAWGRSLWKETGISITTDIADRNQVSQTHEKKALSATSWAAQALAKSAGSTRLPMVIKAARFARQHQEESTGAFGNLYASCSATPLVFQQTFIRSPRHTASGVKLIELVNGLTRDVVSGCEFILDNECRPDGGWGESIGDRPNTLATAYVLDALIKLLQAKNFKSLLSPRKSNSIKPAINRGLAWLINQRKPDHLWQYSGNDEYTPLYTAFVLGFVPQLSESYYEETVESIESLLEFSTHGGIPSLRLSPPDPLTTSLCLYSMLRVDPIRFTSRIHEQVKWIAKKVNSDYWDDNYRCMQGIFSLVALAQLPDIPRKKISNKLAQMFTYISNIENDALNTSEPWLKLNNQLSLNLENAIRGLFQ